jgi:hypothetical protein
MRETPRLGIPISVTMTLLALIVLPHSLYSQELLPAAETVADATETPSLAEPITDLPVTPAPQIDSITLFPNQGEITSATGFSEQRFGYVLHGEASAVYDSNLFIQAQNEEEDFIFRIAPGVSIGWGDFKSELSEADSFRNRFERYVGKNYFYVRYSPSYTWYAAHSDLDTFDQAILLESEWSIQRLTLGLRAGYVTATVPVEDIGNLVEQKRLTAALTSTYDYSGKTSLEINGFYDEVSYNGDGQGSREWRNEDWLNYQITPKVQLGLGGTLAYVERDSAAAQNYEQARMRVIYEASEKLKLSLTGGVEWRQTDDGDDRTNGTYELDVAWSPFDGTYIYLQGYQRSATGNSVGSEYNVATGAVARYRQRLFQRFFFGLTAEYQNVDYVDSATASNQGRTDDLFSVRPGVGFDLATWINCEVTGEYHQNESTDAERGYEATRAMLRFNLLF